MTELASLAQSEGARFRSGDDWFVVERSGALVTLRVGAGAERIVDLWHALTMYLAPAVDVYMADVRSGQIWSGALCALPDVREAIGRLRLTLAAYGGVEVSVYTDTDQLTLTPELALIVYSRTDRWAFLLDSMGLIERAAPPAPTWRPTRAALRPEAQLSQAVEAAAQRMRLREGDR